MNDKYADGFARKLLQNMSDDELRSILRRDAASERTLEPEELDRILDELRRREQPGEQPDPEAAWQLFLTDTAGRGSAYADCAPQPEEQRREHSAPARGRRRGLRWLSAAAAAAAVLASLVAVQAAGVDVFGAIARWTDETFSFSSAGSRRQTDELPAVELDGPVAYASLQQALDTYGVTEVAAPTWIPEEFRLMEVSVDTYGVGLNFTAAYVNEAGRSLIIGFFSTDGKHYGVFEKTDDPPEVFEWDGKKVYAFRNSRNNTLAWTTDHFECSINAPLSFETMKEILFSMSD